MTARTLHPPLDTPVPKDNDQLLATRVQHIPLREILLWRVYCYCIANDLTPNSIDSLHTVVYLIRFGYLSGARCSSLTATHTAVSLSHKWRDTNCACVRSPYQPPWWDDPTHNNYPLDVNLV